MAPKETGKITYLALTCHTLSKKENRSVCECLHSMKVSQGYSENIKKLVSMKVLKLIAFTTTNNIISPRTRRGYKINYTSEVMKGVIKTLQYIPQFHNNRGDSWICHEFDHHQQHIYIFKTTTTYLSIFVKTRGEKIFFKYKLHCLH